MNLLQIKQCVNKYMISPLVHNRKKAKNLEGVSVIASNCIGGVLLHDLGLKFLTPTVNLSFDADDYIKFVSNLEHYLSEDVIELKSKEYPYPLGKIDDVTLYFVHYHSFEEARSKWNERKKRINYDRLFFIFTDQNGCTDEHVEKFSALPYKKVFFTSQKKYEAYDFAVYLDSSTYQKTHNGRTLVDDACIFKGISGKRNFEYVTDIKKFM